MRTLLLPFTFSILYSGLSALGCGGSVSTGGSGSGGATSSSSGGTCGGAPLTASYASCPGTTFFPDGSCAQGSCIANAPSPVPEVFGEWKKQVEALSGYDDQQLFQRVQIDTIGFGSSGGIFSVDIGYVVEIDWIRSRQRDVVQLMGPADPAAITAAVKLAIEAAEWTGLAQIQSAPQEAAVKAAFDGCSCDITVDFCRIDFENVTGKLLLPGFKEIDVAANKCLSARVDLGAGAIKDCQMVPCSIQ